MCLERVYQKHFAISTNCPSRHYFTNVVYGPNVSSLCLPLSKAAGYSVTLAQHVFDGLKQANVRPPFYVCSRSDCEEVPTELRLMGQKIATLKLEKLDPENDEVMEDCGSICSGSGGYQPRDLAAGNSSGGNVTEEASSEADEENNKKDMRLTVEMTTGNCDGEDRTFVKDISANPPCSDYATKAWDRLTRQEKQQEDTSSQSDEDMSEKGSDQS